MVYGKISFIQTWFITRKYTFEYTHSFLQVFLSNNNFWCVKNARIIKCYLAILIIIDLNNLKMLFDIFNFT